MPRQFCELLRVSSYVKYLSYSSMVYFSGGFFLACSRSWEKAGTTLHHSVTMSLFILISFLKCMNRFLRNFTRTSWQCGPSQSGNVKFLNIDNKKTVELERPGQHLTFRHRASCILGQAFHCSPENAFYIFNKQIYFIIWYLLDRASLI